MRDIGFADVGSQHGLDHNASSSSQSQESRARISSVPPIASTYRRNVLTQTFTRTR
jgi:hypothetical protein